MRQDELEAVERQLRDLTGGLRVEMPTKRELPGLFETLARIVRLLQGFQLLLARRIDQTSAPADVGLRNAAEWIAAVTGTSPHAAYEMVTASRRLEHLPRTATAVGRGELSTAEATAIAGAGAADPDAEDRLVDLARSTSLKELREECARVRQAADPDPEATRQRLHRERRLRTHRNEEGFWCLSARGTPDSGAEVKVVLDALIDEIFHEAHGRGVREPREAYAYDALVEMARRSWSFMQAAHSAHADQPDSVGRPRKRRRKKGVNARFLATIRLDYEALTRGWTEGDETCEIPGVGPISVPAARELLEESVIELLVTKARTSPPVPTQAVASTLRRRWRPAGGTPNALAWAAPALPPNGTTVIPTRTTP